MRIDTPWLDPNKNLREQDVTEDDELLLMYRFYYNMELDRNSTAVEMLYKQARATFLAREVFCAHEDIPKFTALLCQIAYGDFVSKEDTQEKLHKLKKTLLPAKLKSKPFVKDVAAYHLLLNGLNEQEAKCWFVKQWSSMKSFGMEFFSCFNWETREKGLVGISKNQIVFLHHNAKKKNLKLDMNSLKSWELDSQETNVVSLVVQVDGTPMKLMLHFPAFYSSIFMDCLQGNRDLSAEVPTIQQSHKEFQFDEEIEKRYSRYSQPSLVHPDLQKLGPRKHKRTGSLTLNDVLYWSETIETPLVSREEKDSWKTESWENPAFGNLDQLMDERFSFLDFESEEKPTISAATQRTRASSLVVTYSSPESSPSTERIDVAAGSPRGRSVEKTGIAGGGGYLDPRLPLQSDSHLSPLAIARVMHKPAVGSPSSVNTSGNSSENNSPVLVTASNFSKTEANGCT